MGEETSNKTRVLRPINKLNITSEITHAAKMLGRSFTVTSVFFSRRKYDDTHALLDHGRADRSPENVESGAVGTALPSLDPTCRENGINGLVEKPKCNEVYLAMRHQRAAFYTPEPCDRIRALRDQCQPRYSQSNEIQANTCTLMRSNVWHMHNGPCRSLLQETKMSPMESPKQGNSTRGNTYINIAIYV